MSRLDFNPILVSVVIVNYKHAEHIRKCLESLRRTELRNFEIIVVDGLTRDFDRIFSSYPEVRLLHFDADIGPAASRNRGAALALGKYFVFLDNDTTVQPDWLSVLVQQLEMDPTLGAAQPMLLRMSNPRLIDGAGDFVDRFGFASSLGQNEIDDGRYNSLREIFSARTACAIVRRSVFEEAHGFDEDFHVELEDVDLGWRIRLLGYRIALVPLSRVHHLAGGTRRRRPFPFHHCVKNHLSMMIKNYSTANVFRNVPPAVAFWIVNLCESIVSRQVWQAQGVMSGLVWPLLHFRSVWTKRRYCQGRRRIRDSELDNLVASSGYRPLLSLGQILIAIFPAVARRLYAILKEAVSHPA